MPDINPKQLYIAYDEQWGELVHWYETHGFMLCEIPTSQFAEGDGDGIPTYCIQPMPRGQAFGYFPNRRKGGA